MHLLYISVGLIIAIAFSNLVLLKCAKSYRVFKTELDLLTFTLLFLIIVVLLPGVGLAKFVGILNVDSNLKFLLSLMWLISIVVTTAILKTKGYFQDERNEKGGKS